MPEDWRTLVDAHLYSINTSMVPEVIDLSILFIAFKGERCFDMAWCLSITLCGTFYIVPDTLNGKSLHLVTVLRIKHTDSKLHGVVLGDLALAHPP